MIANIGEKRSDSDVQVIVHALNEYLQVHQSAEIQVQRLNNVIIRIRVIDPDFRTLDRVDRDNALWKILERLPDDVQSQITMVLLLTPEETATSFANMEFERPVALAN